LGVVRRNKSTSRQLKLSTSLVNHPAVEVDDVAGSDAIAGEFSGRFAASQNEPRRRQTSWRKGPLCQLVAKLRACESFRRFEWRRWGSQRLVKEIELELS
jgi:hypothetical protein